MIYCDIFCIILVATLLILILYKKYYIDEPFLFINDSSLYISNDNNVNNSPVQIKYQMPVYLNQLNDKQLQDIDSNVLRNVRPLVNFSMTDELDIYQMYNILKKMKKNSYTFNYDMNSIAKDKKAKVINSENILKVNSGAINNIDLELFTRIKLEIISAFNNLIINSGYYVDYHPYHFFKIINSNLISFDKKIDILNITEPGTSTTKSGTSTTKTNTTKPNTTKPSTSTSPTYNCCMTLTVAREYKYQQFIIYYDIDIQIQNNINYTMILNKVEIEGIPIPNTIEFHNNKKVETNLTSDIQLELEKIKEQENINNYYYKDQVSDSALFDVISAGGNSNIVKNQNMKYIDNTDRSDMDLTLFDKNSLSSKIDEKIMNISKDKHFNNNLCFGLVNGVSQVLPQYKTPISCKSYHPDINQNGIWDAPCQIDSDCPFNNANKNYPNDFGKCDISSGSCEMPLGIIPIGFTKYGKIEPNCYNCSIDSKDSKCCSKQVEYIKSGDVKYVSPDYIFSGDEIIRNKNKTELEKLGLYAIPSI